MVDFRTSASMTADKVKPRISDQVTCHVIEKVMPSACPRAGQTLLTQALCHADAAALPRLPGRRSGGLAGLSEDDVGSVVGGVAARSLFGIQPGRWGPERDAVLDVHLPPEFLEGAVVEAADEAEVVEVRRAAVDPLGDVMDLGPGGGAIAAGEGAAAVPGGEGEALTAGGQPAAGAVGEDPAGVGENHREHLGHQREQRLGRDHLPVTQ